MAAETEFSLLGPLEARRDGTVVPVRTGKQQALLAALLLRAGRPVGLAELTDVLWGAGAPPSARVSLQNYVARLRQDLGAAGIAVETEPGAYRIVIAPGALDVTRFEAALQAGRAAAQEGAWADAAAVLRAGLALWRGDPLAGVDSELLVAREVPRLAELRLQALEARIEADLQLGLHADVVAELRSLTAAQPLRERLHGLLMTALYRDGQQAAALAAYQQARRALVAELGAEPGPELQQLQRRILTADPALDAPARPAQAAGAGAAGRPEPGDDAVAAALREAAALAAAGSGPAAPVRYSLPPDTAAFTGRSAELDLIAGTVAALAQPGGVVAIRAVNGMPGVGKTALAVRAGHLLAGRFPDRLLFVNLHGHTPGQDPVDPAAALAGLLAAQGVDPRFLPADLPGRAALWRDKMAGRKALLILDNAASSAQVTPLLPGGSGCLVLVTSRRQLADLPGAVAVLLEVLPPDQAARMFTRLAPRAAAAPSAAVAGLVELAGYLPLAISLLARVFNRHPAWTLADLAAETRSSLLTLTAENDSVAAAFGLSWQQLSAPQRGLLALLGLHPGTAIDAYAAAALAAIPVGRAAALLDDLHREGLLTETGYRRYGMHDLIRRYAADRAATLPGAERGEALGRLLDYYQDAAGRAEALLSRQARPRPAAALAAPPAAVPAMADAAAALAWERAERPSLVACLEYAARTGQRARLVALTAAMSELLLRDGPWAEAVDRHAAAAAAAAALGDRPAQADALASLGMLSPRAGDRAGGVLALRQALDIYRDLGDRLGQADILNDLADQRRLAGDIPGATGLSREALAMSREAGSRRGEAAALLCLGDMQRMGGDYPAAAGFLREALEAYRNAGDRVGEASALRYLGEVQRLTGNFPAAAGLLGQTLAICRELGDPLGQANALSYLGAVAQQTGDYPAADQIFTEALRLYRHLGNQAGAANSLRGLGTVRRAAGDLGGATDLIAEAVAIHCGLGVRSGQAAALGELGITRRMAGDGRGAARALRESLAIFQHLGDRLSQAKVLNEMGALHRGHGGLAVAAARHRQALDLAREVAGPWEEAAALAGLARCALAGGDAAAAAAGLRRARQIYERIGGTGVAEVAAITAELAALSAPENRIA